jgi:hypothetical protein
MPEDRFDVYFCGSLIAGQDPVAARANVRRLFKATDAQLERLFSGAPVAVKKDIDLDAASRYRLAFRQAGALVEIRPHKAGQPASAPDHPARQPDAMTLLPANTGSLEEFAPRTRPAPLPDISHMDMAAAGVQLDDTPPPASVRIATDDLSLVTGQDWSLEDCQLPPLPQVLPDIEDLQLAPPGEPIPAPAEAEAPALPDISGMRLVPDDENSR